MSARITVRLEVDLVDLGLRDSKDFDSLRNSEFKKWDFGYRSPQNSTGRRKRPVSKTHKRTSTTLSKKKRNSSTTHSMRRDEMLRQYLGHNAKSDISYSKANKSKSSAQNSKKINRSFHLPKTSVSQAPTPQLK